MLAGHGNKAADQDMGIKQVTVLLKEQGIMIAVGTRGMSDYNHSSLSAQGDRHGQTAKVPSCLNSARSST